MLSREKVAPVLRSVLLSLSLPPTTGLLFLPRRISPVPFDRVESPANRGPPSITPARSLLSCLPVNRRTQQNGTGSGNVEDRPRLPVAINIYTRPRRLLTRFRRIHMYVNSSDEPAGTRPCECKRATLLSYHPVGELFVLDPRVYSRESERHGVTRVPVTGERCS